MLADKNVPTRQRCVHNRDPIIHGPNGPVYSSVPHTAAKSSQVHAEHYEFFLPESGISNEKENGIESVSKSDHTRQCHAQQTRWNDDVLPRLIHPFLGNHRRYFEHLATDSEPAGSESNHCSCFPLPKALSVLAVYMDRTETVFLQVCTCRTAPIQLIERGLFPCAPVWPTLAVCLNMLEFVSQLFLHLAPNERAWVTTLEMYLRARGFFLKEVLSHYLNKSSVPDQLD